MQMDIYDYKRLLDETVERVQTAFEELKSALEEVEETCSYYEDSDDTYRVIKSALSEAVTNAELEINSVIQTGQLMRSFE